MSLVLDGCSSGFFSCCYITIMKVCDYFNEHKRLPTSIDCSQSYSIYKRHPSEDVYTLFFKTDNDIQIEYTEKIFYGDQTVEFQFSPYKSLPFKQFKPFIDKYFSFNQNVLDASEYLIKKYNINLENTCGVFYRGNDKVKETQKPSYHEVVEQAENIRKENLDIQFVVQTDEYEFLKYFQEKFPDAIYFQEIPIINNQMTTVAYVFQNDDRKSEYILFFLASVNIFSKFKKLITTSGNGEIFIMFYRNNADGLTQYLKQNEYIYGQKVVSYDPTQTQFWYTS